MRNTIKRTRRAQEGRELCNIVQSDAGKVTKGGQRGPTPSGVQSKTLRTGDAPVAEEIAADAAQHWHRDNQGAEMKVQKTASESVSEAEKKALQEYVRLGS